MISDILLKLLILAYAGVGVANIVAFWPTIKDLYFHKKKSANIHSYLIWTICGAIAFLYGVFVLQDTLYLIISGANLICCALILFLSIGLKKK